MTDHLSPQAATWRRDEADASVTLRTQAADDFRRWADEERAQGNDLRADDCSRMADRLDRLFPKGGAP